jgi:hypothetical protein
MAIFFHELLRVQPIVLHYAHMTGCGGCAMVSPHVDAVQDELDRVSPFSPIMIKKYNIAERGVTPPFPVQAVPHIVLEVRGVGKKTWHQPPGQVQLGHVRNWIPWAIREIKAGRGER